MCLVVGGIVLEDGVCYILNIFDKGFFIFNFGYGVILDVDLDNVVCMVEMVKGV